MLVKRVERAQVVQRADAHKSDWNGRKRIKRNFGGNKAGHGTLLYLPDTYFAFYPGIASQ
jgi:hypothetical protein